MIDRITDWLINYCSSTIVNLRFFAKCYWLRLYPIYSIKYFGFSAIAVKLYGKKHSDNIPFFGIDYWCFQCKKAGWSDWIDPWSHSSKFSCIHCGQNYQLAEVRPPIFIYGFYYKYLCQELAIQKINNDLTQDWIKIYKNYLKNGIPYEEMPQHRNGESFSTMELIHLFSIVTRCFSKRL